MKSQVSPLIEQKLQMEKFSGKGGWTYVRLPGIEPDKNAPFGWRKVRGTIDGIEIRKYHLMSMGNGQLFLPVKAAIRKKLKKEAGDWVDVALFPDNEPTEIPEEFEICLKDDPDAWRNFLNFTQQARQRYYTWIYEVKTDEKKVERMAIAIGKISRNELL